MRSMKQSKILPLAAFACALALHSLAAARAEACTAADFGAVVDQTAQALRDLNGSGAQRLQAKLQSVRQKQGLSEDEIEARASALQDDKMSEFNREIEALVNQMDALSQTPNDKITCEKLEELKRVRDRLLTVMGQKSGYMLAKADVELDRPASPGQRAPSQPDSRGPGKPPAGLPEAGAKEDRLALTPPPTSDNSTNTRPNKPESPAVETGQKERPALKPALPERRREPAETAKNWTPEDPSLSRPTPDRREALAEPLSQEPPTSLAPPPDGYQQQQLPIPSDGAETTYSIAEIQEAGRGVFGTISAQFAGAVNYAFQRFGRPNAYIKGSEGGAALLAGLRYGKGSLHSKAGPESPIYWQGPSFGYDVGAEGSNALFLVYNLEDPFQIYGRFSGVGGSAYVAGGVGLNVLGKGSMVMVPIRSGIGLRLGANLAYLKFTERQTWNPF